MVIEIKAQAWSIDIALAVIVFIAAFFVIHAIITSKTPSEMFSLKQEVERVSKELISQNSSLNVVNGEVLNETKVQSLLDQDYEEIRKKLRVKDDFCVYFEDDEGNIINMTNSSGDYASGIGSPNITVTGGPCR